MPDFINARANQLNKLPEHTAAAAAVKQGEPGHMTAHEETVQAKEHAREASEQADKLHHGKEARLAHEATQATGKPK